METVTVELGLVIVIALLVIALVFFAAILAAVCPLIKALVDSYRLADEEEEDT